MTDAAMMFPQGNSCELAPEISAIATGTVRMSLVKVKVSANRNSFQAAMNASRPVVTSAGPISGMNTRVTMVNGVAPSGLWQHVAVLLAYALFGFYVSLVLFRRRLSQ